MIDSRATLSVLVVQALTYCLPGASSTSLHVVMFLLVIVQARMMYILQAREKARRSNEPSMSPTENSRLDKARLELDPSLYRARAQTSKLARGWLVDSPRYTALKHTKKNHRTIHFFLLSEFRPPYRRQEAPTPSAILFTCTP